MVTVYCMNERLRSGDQTESDCVWVREHHKLHHLTQSAKTMLLKSLTQRYDFQNEARWSSQSRDLMICSLALDPRFKQFAVQLCGLSRGEDYVWGVVAPLKVRMMNSHAQHQRDQKLAFSVLFIDSLPMGLQYLVVLKPTKNGMHRYMQFVSDFSRLEGKY